MPVYLIEWELSGCMPIVAETPEDAEQVARRDFWQELQGVMASDADFYQPVLAKCLEHAQVYDGSLEANSGVYGSSHALSSLLPSDPNWRQK